MTRERTQASDGGDGGAGVGSDDGHATVVPSAHLRPPRAPESRAPPNDAGHDDGDDGAGVGSDDGVVRTVAMKLRDDRDDGGQLR